MTWKTIRLELARTPEFPEGSATHSYILRLPLDDDDLIDRAALKHPSESPAVRIGVMISQPGGWAFSYEVGDADDEGVFHLENHPIRLGQYLTITEADGERLPFKVVSCHD
jgi:hypothetical protein